MRRFYTSLFVTGRFYLVSAAIVVLYVFAFFWPVFIWVPFIIAVFFIVTIIIDILLLYSRRKPVKATRLLPERLSNGDENHIKLVVSNNYAFQIKLLIKDEVPVTLETQFPNLHINVKGNETINVDYHLKPVNRGAYLFGDLLFFSTTFLNLIERRVVIAQKAEIACYPSFIQLKKYQLLAAANRLSEAGVRNVRKLGHSLEFDHIKEYVQGDDYRTVNWKATARKGGALMVNSFTDERSQHIYCIINTGRVMKMPFEGLSLLDYSINASLVLSNIALQKQDKAGLITYGDKWLHNLAAGRTPLQMQKILHHLYKVNTAFTESDMSRLVSTVKTTITQRSLLVYFTNYESLSAAERDLPYLRLLNKNHLLVLVFFENTELKLVTENKPENIQQVYTKIIAEKFIQEKKIIVSELRKNGILSILATPQKLTINTLNKYLEIKARHLI